MMPLIVLRGMSHAELGQYRGDRVARRWWPGLYSVPPFRLKERPPLDSLANGLGYFLLPFMMGYSLNADPRDDAAAVLFAGAMRVRAFTRLATAADYDADRAAGHRTLAVVFGRRTAAAFAFAAFLLAWHGWRFRKRCGAARILACVLS